MHHRYITSRLLTLLFAICAAILSAAPVWAISAGQIDSFDSSLHGWSGGPGRTLVSGGPAGPADTYLRVQTTAASGAGSRLVTYNTAQWAGDYLAVGVNRIEIDVRNDGPTPLALRIGLEGAGSTQYVSATPRALAVGSGWQTVSFDLTADQFQRVSGFASFDAVLAAVTHVRIFSNPTLDWIGEMGNGVLGLDNVRAPGPTALTWRAQPAAAAPLLRPRPLVVALLLALATGRLGRAGRLGR